ncbi:GntR family transcriptional regulator [Celeribacter sp.]|uniref:GntR family transcriptional regulator n=1 Tax=Celeribacter sp. TaxID=1890673 RepID=UPI003A932570
MANDATQSTSRGTQPAAKVQLTAIDQARVPSVTDMVYDALYHRIVELQLRPGTKMSEAEVASQLGVSRQPVRDAFYRLSQQGFLLIRPQRATTVTPISVSAVLEARFIRTALEMETLRAAMLNMTDAGVARLEANIAAQKNAMANDDRTGFHELDDALHEILCDIAGRPKVWTIIKDNKAHMDRVRYLSLGKGSQLAYDDHCALLVTIKARDTEAASTLMRAHLERIGHIIDDIRAEHGEFFENEDERGA